MLYIGIAIGIIVGLTVTVFLYEGSIPFVDRGGQIIATTDPRHMRAIVKALEICGFKVAFHRNTAGVQRTFMKKGNLLLIVNCTVPELHKKMGSPHSGTSVVVDDPAKFAKAVARCLSEEGFSTESTGKFDEDAPDGMLDGALLPNGTLLVTRRHALKMGRPDKVQSSK